MRKIILLCLIWALPTTLAFARECPAGYEPLGTALSVQASDIDRMDLAEADKGAAKEKVATFQSKEEAMQTEFRNKNAEVAMMLAEQDPDRSRIDPVAARLTDLVQEISDLRVTHFLEMVDSLKAGNLRKVKAKPRQRLAHCVELISVPRMRQALTGKEKEIIGITEDEIKYLNDFERREKSFRAEQKELRLRLDRTLNVRDIDRGEVRLRLEALGANVRQQVTNRLDRYFYADQVLFSPERMKQLSAFHAKHVKRAKTPKRAK